MNGLIRMMSRLERIDFCIKIDWILLQGDSSGICRDSIKEQIDNLLRERFKLMLIWEGLCI